MESYPFLDYINEDKSRYQTATDAGYIDDQNLFLIGDSGGFLLNINPDVKFVDTHLMYEVADHYRQYKEYTPFKVDSIPHRQFRNREQHRREHGLTVPCLLMPDGTIKDVRITGSHYNFLNYTMIKQLDESSIIIGKNNVAKKKVDFAKFIDAQFWIFHVMEFVKKNGKHLLIDKTRRGGFSYIMASDSSNTINLRPHQIVIHVAKKSQYLTDSGGLTDFAITNLINYEEKTPFSRGILRPSAEDFRLGFRNVKGVESDKSWKSALLSVSAFNDSNCAIGKDAIDVNVEEVSTMGDFDAFMNVTEPAMRTGAYTTGCLKAWGTATDGDMITFEQNFYNPNANNFMAFENVWDTDSRSDVCGFFKAYCWGLQGEINGQKAMDKDGNSNILLGLEIAKQERQYNKDNAKSYADYIKYLGQYAIKPSESFSNASENIFTSEALSEWETRLKNDKELHFYIDGMYEEVRKGVFEFQSNERRRAKGLKAFDYINSIPRKSSQDPEGCIRRWFAPERMPLMGKDGVVRNVVPENLYEITYDPVGIDKEKKLITDKHSHNSIFVWMKPHYINNFQGKLVAAYYGRPAKLEEADKICYMLAVDYNCIRSVHAEVNRGETVSNFKKWDALKYLAYEPIFIWDIGIKDKYSTTYGYVISDGIKKLECLRLLKEFLYTKIGVDEDNNDIYMFHRIYDQVFFTELKKWKDEGNFDRVSQALLKGITNKAYNLKAEKEMKKSTPLTGENLDRNDILSRPWFTTK